MTYPTNYFFEFFISKRKLWYPWIYKKLAHLYLVCVIFVKLSSFLVWFAIPLPFFNYNKIFHTTFFRHTRTRHRIFKPCCFCSQETKQMKEEKPLSIFKLATAKPHLACCQRCGKVSACSKMYAACLSPAGCEEFPFRILNIAKPFYTRVGL